MSTTTLSPLRQRMIEDMSLRNLAPRTQVLHPWLPQAGGVPAPLARYGNSGGYPSLPAASGRAGCEHLHPQPHDDRGRLPVPCDAETL